MSVTGRGGRNGKSTRLTHVEGREVETQPGQSTDLPNLYLSLPSLVLGIAYCRMIEQQQWVNAPMSVTGHGGRIGKSTRLAHVEGWEFETQPCQSTDLQNLYLGCLAWHPALLIVG